MVACIAISDLSKGVARNVAQLGDGPWVGPVWPVGEEGERRGDYTADDPPILVAEKSPPWRGPSRPVCLPVSH